MFKISNRFFILVVIVLLLILAGAYFFYQAGDSNHVPQDDLVEENSPTDNLTDLPISPVSPLSPVMVPNSPLPIPPNSTFDVEEIFAKIDQAELAYKEGNYDEALRIIDEVMAVDPNNPFAYNTRGNTYTALNRYNEAMTDYSRAIALDPELSFLYYNRGRLHNLLENYDDAISDLQKSVELSPVEFGYRAYGAIGLIYHNLSQYDKALEAFETSISYNRDERADIYYYRGETHTALNDYDAAIDDYQAALSRFSRYDEAYQGLGYAYYKTAQYDQALEALNEALEISPNSAIAHFYLGLVYLAMDQFDDAEAAFAQATDSISTLSEEEQEFISSRVLTDLETFAQENPDQADEVDALINLIPEP